MTALKEFSAEHVANHPQEHLVEASAGTGKTYSLCSLYLDLVERQRIPERQRITVDRILVVTFSRAATAELRDRMRQRLRERLVDLRANGEGEGEAARFIGEQLRQFDRAAIYTIHGFCQRLLVEHAFETRMSFAPGFIEDDRALQAEVATDVYARAFYGATQEQWDFAVEKDLRHETVKGFVEQVALTPHVEVGAPAEVDTASTLRRELWDASVNAWEDVPHQKGDFTFSHQLTYLADNLTESLVQKMAKQYAWVLVDEYQDTDPVQARIFARLFSDNAVPMVFVGDPKQAVYGFRGADLFAYLAAKRRTGIEVHGLKTNYRSSPSLIAALNQLYTGAPDALGQLEGVQYDPVNACPKATDLLEGRRSLEVAWVDDALGLKTRANAKDPKNYNVAKDDQWMALMAADVTRLLAGEATLAGQRIQPNQIAVLVSTNAQAQAAQQALRAQNVPCVVIGSSSVLASDAAADLQALLDAVARPSDRRALKAAMVTPIIGVTGDALLAMRDDEARWDEVVEHFRVCHTHWRERGFVPSVDALLHDLGAHERLLRRPDGERQLTNLLHLLEVLAEEDGGRRLAPAAIAQRLRTLRQGTGKDEGSELKELRIEADAAALQIMTVHKSKGLEFDVVYCPTLSGEGKPRCGRAGGDLMKRTLAAAKKSLPFLYHDPAQAFRPTLELGDGADHDNAARLLGLELFAERAHLVYVALTRAKQHVVVQHSRFEYYEDTCLAQLLHRSTERAASLTLENTLSDLQELAARSEGHIGVRRASFDSVPYTPEATTATLAAREFGERKRLNWTYRRTSYSALTRDALHAWHRAPSAWEDTAAEAGVEVDGSNGAHDEDAPASAGRQATAAAHAPLGKIHLTPDVLTLGADVGNALHGFFEHVDFQDPGEDADVQALVARQLRLVGQKLPGNLAAVTQALRSALSAPFSDGEPTLALSAILKVHRLDEMTFDMAVALPSTEQEHGSAVSAKALGAAFRQHATSDAVRAYADRVQTLPFAAVRGYLTGAVDLIFRWDHSGRWYVVDYKTNYLGDDWSHYAPAALSVTMSESHYMLQYHLYCVALHRHLRRVLVDYDYERDFGGVYYLFVRGMRHDGPSGFGVYADRPSAALVGALDDLLRLGSGGASS